MILHALTNVLHSMISTGYQNGGGEVNQADIAKLADSPTASAANPSGFLPTALANARTNIVQPGKNAATKDFRSCHMRGLVKSLIQ
jgi:hypothetical protein